jgi:hypothetical protein
MGRRSRKGHRAAGGASGSPAPPSPAPVRATPPKGPSRPSRSEAKAEEIRAGLVPLAEGERPAPLTVGAVVAGVIAVGNVIAYAAGLHVKHAKSPTLSGILVLSGLMAACAYGLWRSRYWAVLGFEALLALTVIFAALSLSVSASLRGAAISLAIVLLGGWLFYKLVRVMARIQMPQRERERRR